MSWVFIHCTLEFSASLKLITDPDNEPCVLYKGLMGPIWPHFGIVLCLPCGDRYQVN